MITDFEKALITHDKMTQKQANTELHVASNKVYNMLNNGAHYEDIEEMLECDYGLAMDYVMDLL
jgi:predicted XRE-type DNA-binding protein